MKDHGNNRTKPITRAQILRSVAASTAIETGRSIEEIERRLQETREEFAHITLKLDASKPKK